MLKYQIFIQFDKKLKEENLNDFTINTDSMLIVNTDKHGNFINIIPENEEEKELIKKELVNTLISKVKRLKTKTPLTINGSKYQR